MARPTANSFRLFRFAGIDVYLHWSWLLVALIEIRVRALYYRSLTWNVLEYVALFGIVLLHEFGHALTCRSVGGVANFIVLWPLGGVAYVSPPPRPGAVLWSIAAGPLVNLVLVLPTAILYLLAIRLGWRLVRPDVFHFVLTLTVMNVGLMVLNLLPIYPLDGGQILQALLWFAVGRVRSLMVVSIIGMVVGVGVLLAALGLGGIHWTEVWLGAIAVYVVYRAAVGFQESRLLSRVLSGPRHKEAVCPACAAAPAQGEYWGCGHCGTSFDPFTHRGVCPKCGCRFDTIRCLDCYRTSSVAAWFALPGAAASGNIEI
jgi:Zn-dependent protease